MAADQVAFSFLHDHLIQVMFDSALFFTENFFVFGLCYFIYLFFINFIYLFIFCWGRAGGGNNFTISLKPSDVIAE